MVNEYESAKPSVIHEKSTGRWGLEWDRSVEADLIAEFINQNRSNTSLVYLSDADSSSYSSILGYLSARNKYKVQRRRSLYYGARHIIPAIAASYLDRSKKFPIQIGAEILKSTSGAGIYSSIDSYSFRVISNYIHRQRRAGAPCTLREALSRASIVPAYEHSLLDVKLDRRWSEDKANSSAYGRLFQMDIAMSNDIARELEGYIFPFYNYYGYGAPPVEKILAGLGLNCAVWLEASSSTIQGISSYETNDNRSIVMNVAVESFDDVHNMLKPMIDHYNIDEAMFGDIVRGAGRVRRVGNQPSIVFGEGGINSAISAIEKAGKKSIELDSIDPQLAPIDAEVVGGILILGGDGVPPSTNTPTDQLEVLRSEYLDEVERLLGMLQGANVGPGFNARLKRILNTLESPMTHASSLQLATQVRAMEDLFPAVRELLTDITAADVGATISGLGLYVRQFPAWRNFLEEAQDRTRLDSGILDALDLVAKAIISQPNEVVQSNLREGLEGIGSAASETQDPAIQFGYLRGISNIYRAIGRYMRDRIVAMHGSFTSTLEKEAGELIARGALAAIVGSVSGPLLQLATGVPVEFGWLVGLIAIMGTNRR